MIVEALDRAGQAALEQIIERRIMEHTCRRIRQLRVEVDGERVVVNGQTLWYHVEQLAMLAVLEALDEAGAEAVVDMRIRVSASPGRGHHLAVL
jgi:hypothetical protein